MTRKERPVAVSLFDESGNMLRPWAEAGYECHMYDLIEEEREPEIVGDGILIWHRGTNLDDLRWHRHIISLQPDFLAAFAPCDDLAVSGSKHFAGKLEKDPFCQQIAVERIKLVERLANEVDKPWMSENPVSMAASLWRKPDHYFDPCDYGGYLPEDDVHPRWPTYLPPRDAYRKKTSIWSGNGFVMPPKRPVAPVSNDNPGWKKLGGKSAKTKQIRSETPRGFGLAVCEANCQRPSLTDIAFGVDNDKNRSVA